jgi:hypothetical protein
MPTPNSVRPLWGLLSEAGDWGRHPQPPERERRGGGVKAASASHYPAGERRYGVFGDGPVRVGRPRWAALWMLSGVTSEE